MSVGVFAAVPITPATPVCTHRLLTSATCTTPGGKCKECGVVVENVPKLEHDWGSWSKNDDGKTHIQYCKRTGCSASQTANHGSWKLSSRGDSNSDQHKLKCGDCTYIKFVDHNSKKIIKIEDEENHKTACSVCYNNTNETVRNGKLEAHTWTKGNDAPHECSACGYVKKSGSQYQYHCYGIDTPIIQTEYTCLLDNCSTTINLENGTLMDIQGEVLAKYSASDSKADMSVPQFTNGTYTLYWTCSDGSTPKIRNSEGNIISPTLNLEWVTLYGWSQRTIRKHIIAAMNEATRTETTLEGVLATWGKAIGMAGGDIEAYEQISSQTMIVLRNTLSNIITEAPNVLSENYYESWSTLFTLIDVLETINNGNEHKPTVTYDSSSVTYSIEFNAQNGGWMFKQSPFFPSDDRYNTELFRIGEYEKEPPDEWYANIYYCYRLLDGSLPKNGYDSLYSYKKALVYKGEDFTVTYEVPADMGKISQTGYRFVGSATDVGSANSVKVSERPTSKDSSPSVTVGWNYQKSAAIVTFFLEPVELEYGHKWRDMSSLKLDDQVLNEKTLSRLKEFGQEPLQFPDYYKGPEEGCVIEVRSLNKWIWPGFILKSFEVNDLNGKNIEEKTYTDKTTTVYSEEEKRLVVTENIKSTCDSEKEGYASNKIAWFIYNTPQLKIEHKDYNTKNLLKDDSGKDITGIQQILHEWAKIESLMTDNIGLPHKITIGDLIFTYSYPELSLVQIEIYEVSQDGKEALKGIAYENDKYKPKSKGKKITGYSGVFADYYMETYSELRKSFNDLSLFNTNKNWRIVFVYDEIEKLHVRFFDKNGNVIFSKNDEGRFVSEIISEIEKSTGASHTIKNIGDYTPIRYTISDNQYNKDFDAATHITHDGTNYNPNTLSVSSGTGDKYIAIFYSTEDVLKIDYRDTDNNPIQVPPNYVSSVLVDLPNTGVFITVPEVPGYIVKEYKINPNYNGVDTFINGAGYAIVDPHTQISVPSNGNDQYIIIYYEKEEAQTKLIVECRNETISGDLLMDPIEIPLITGKDTEISIPSIDGYVPKFWVKEGENIENLPSVKIIVVGSPEKGNQKVIIVYTVGTSGQPSPIGPIIITPEDTKERVELKANTVAKNEYDTLIAIPTSEDLYVSGDVFSYRFTHDITQIDESQNIKVRVDQKYITDLNDITKTNTASSNVFDVTLDYSYYKVNSAKLYDLKSLNLKNDAIKYYKDYDKTTGSYTECTEGEANFGVNKSITKIVYTEPTTKFEIKLGKTSVGTLSKEGDIYVITLNDVAYVEPKDMNKRFNSNSLGEVNEVLGELATVHLNKLAIETNIAGSKDEVVVLTGSSYTLNQKTEALGEGVNYLPFTPGRAPLYKFVEDKGLYVKESALNIPYHSSLTGMYYKIEELEGKDIVLCIPANELYPEMPIAVNLLNVYTPIVNKTEIVIPAEYENSIQLKDTGVAGTNEIIVLDKEFSIVIPNDGMSSSNPGYNMHLVNNRGLLNNDDNDGADKMLLSKSEDKLYTSSMYSAETEEKSIGPSFAEYKLIRFPYDVYLTNAENGSVLLKQNQWHNLYEYLRPSVTEYKFTVPVWVEDSKEYKADNGIHVLIVAENCPSDILNSAKNNPMSIGAIGTINTKDQYILRKSIDTYVAGRVYGLQIRDTDDIGLVGKIKPALAGDITSETSIKEMPIAQAGQVPAYKMGLKLGYRFYFDLKTKGNANESINIKPSFYYVDSKGNVTNNISVFYNSNLGMYTKLTENDLIVKMILSNTHGLTNNSGYTGETIAAKQLNPNRVFNTVSNIGGLLGGLKLQRSVNKLPYDNIAESSNIYKFTNINDFIESLKDSSQINGNQNLVKDSTGHWYGEYYIPASTIVVGGEATTKQAILSGTAKPYTDGYLIVVFEEIITTNKSGNEYLTYSMPVTNTQWFKEGIDRTIILPNGTQTTLPITANSPMAIYQVGLRSNNDFETVGTH